jgi:hypothetical protein
VEDESAGEGKVGECARDLVGGCRRCGTVVCRVGLPFWIQNFMKPGINQVRI